MPPARRVSRWRAPALSGRLADEPHRPARPSSRIAAPTRKQSDPGVTGKVLGRVLHCRGGRGRSRSPGATGPLPRTPSASFNKGSRRSPHGTVPRSTPSPQTSSTMRIFSEYCLQAARRMSLTTCSAGAFPVPDLCLIFVPSKGCDEPEILRSESSRPAPISADTGQFTKWLWGIAFSVGLV
jgi:hypothetical protein